MIMIIDHHEILKIIINLAGCQIMTADRPKPFTFLIRGLQVFLIMMTVIVLVIVIVIVIIIVIVYKLFR